MIDEYPYPECQFCKDLGDCKHIDIAQDGLGTPLPPDSCPKSIDIMRATLKKKNSYVNR